ncbi:MAG: acyl-CoA thioesterase II [Deltaproteobacteria bacterium]|nr:acyl-CoA thioesterase II [Deltaproteobacteria bacterium]
MSTAARLLELLDLERIDRDLFRGHNPPSSRPRLFGGQVLAQGLVAALRTVEGRRAHSLHAYFLRPGDPKVPTIFDVDRIRDGKSFTTRRVVAIQNGEAILSMSVSFQTEAEGLEYQMEPPPGPLEPEGVPYQEEMRSGVERLGFAPPEGDMLFDPPVEVRTVGGMRFFDAGSVSPRFRSWMRTHDRLPDDPGLHQAVLAYASDMTLGGTTMKAHKISVTSGALHSASLDHAMWFHRRFRIDDWLLFNQECVVTSGSRGFARGTFFTREGQVVASCTQEGLLRLLKAK